MNESKFKLALLKAAALMGSALKADLDAAIDRDVAAIESEPLPRNRHERRNAARRKHKHDIARKVK